MPLVLIIAGLVLLICAVRNTQQQLFLLLADDFTGSDNFIFWFLSIVAIGAIGYVPKLKPISDGFLILVILTLFLKKGTGFFDQFQKQITTTQSATPVVSSPTATAGFFGSTGGTGATGATGSTGGTGVNVNAGGVSVGAGSGGVNVGVKVPLCLNLGRIQIGTCTKVGAGPGTGGGGGGGTPPIISPGGGGGGF